LSTKSRSLSKKRHASSTRASPRRLQTLPPAIPTPGHRSPRPTAAPPRRLGISSSRMPAATSSPKSICRPMRRHWIRSSPDSHLPRLTLPTPRRRRRRFWRQRKSPTRYPTPTM
jgi:hypothetical protein